VPTLPYVVVYGPDGNLISRITGLDIDALKHALNKDTIHENP